MITKIDSKLANQAKISLIIAKISSAVTISKSYKNIFTS